MSIAIKRNFTIPSTSAIGASELYITSGVGSTSTGTGALQVSGGAGISGNLSVGGNLNLFNGAFYTGLRSSATATTTYTLPPTSPSTGSSVLSSDAAGNLSWILMSASGSGFTLNGLTSSTQYFSTSISGSGFSSSSIGSTHTFYIGLAGNASTGLISSASQTLFGLKTFASGVAITSATASTSTLTGSLTITGGVGIGGSLWTSSTNYSSISGVGISNGVITGSLTGTATSAAQINIDASTGTRYLIGTLLNTASGSTQLSTGSGITIGNNIITATTFAGNATSSTTSGSSGKWITSRTVTFATGDVTGSFSLDGSADVSNVALTIGANSVALGTDTTGNYVGTVTTSGSGISTIGSAGEGTTFTIDSNATSNNTASTLVFRDSSGNFSAGTISASLTGTASIATSAANLNTVTDTSSTLYLIGSRSSTGIASTQVYVDTNISFSGNTITATTFSGTATSALNAGTQNTVSDTTSTIYFTGSRLSTGTAATTSYVLSGVSALGNTVTATTFSGTATSSTNTANTNITLDTTSTIYLTGSRSNASIGSTPVYVLSGVSALGSTITATTFTGTLSGTASSAALINIAASTATRYLAAVTLNTASGSTQLFTGSGITIGDNRLTTGGLAVTSGTASTNTTTGALTINGGVGITGQLSINTMALGSTGVAVTPSIVFAGSAGTVITMSVLSDTTLAWEGSSGQLFSIDNNLSSGEIFSVSDISGLPLISASAGQTITLNEFGGFTQVGNGLASTSTTTGALRVIGGIGITGNAYVGGSINANAGTNSTSTTTGAVVINGGLGVTGNANIGGTVRIQNTTAATGNSSAAFTVAGGAGIGQSLFVAGNSNLSGSVFTGTNTYTKNLGSGDIALDNGSVDSPAILFYWGNNRNMGVDTFYSGAGTTRFRIVRELNEVGGSELWSVDRNGIVTRSAWDVGEVINTRVYNNSDLSMSATTTINSTTYTNVATITYTPKSSTSHLWIEFDAHYDFSNGTTTDDFFSRITVAGSSIVEKNQIMVGQVGGGTRSGTIFPISGRYTNSSTSGIAITVQAKWGSADDAIRVYGSSTSGYMRIQEIGR